MEAEAWWLPMAGGGGNEEWLKDWNRVSALQDAKVLEISLNNVNIRNTTELPTFTWLRW